MARGREEYSEKMYTMKERSKRFSDTSRTDATHTILQFNIS